MDESGGRMIWMYNLYEKCYMVYGENEIRENELELFWISFGTFLENPDPTWS